MHTFRACLDCRIFRGFLEDVVPKERKHVGAFGTRERRFPFRRKGNELHAFHRKKSMRSKPMEITLAGLSRLHVLFLPWITRAEKIRTSKRENGCS